MSEVLDYPSALIKDIIQIDPSADEFPNLAADYMAVLDSMLINLPGRTRDVLRMRYEERKTLCEIANQFQISKERVRQITQSGIRQLQTDPLCEGLTVGMSNMLIMARQHGYSDGEAIGYKKGYAACEADVRNRMKAKLPMENMNSVPLEDLDLSARTLHCLLRQHVDTVDDVINYPLSDLMSIRGFGSTCYHEIVTRLSRLGVINPTEYSFTGV